MPTMNFKTFFFKFLRWLPALFIFGCSWYLSSQSRVDFMPEFHFSDKVVHCSCFAILTFFVAFAVYKKNYVQRIQFWLPVAIVSFYGVIDEFHQSLVPGRSCDIFDWFADTLGAVIGSAIFLFIIKKSKNN